MFGNHGLGGLLEEGAHEKSPKCLDGNLGDFGEFCKGLRKYLNHSYPLRYNCRCKVLNYRDGSYTCNEGLDGKLYFHIERCYRYYCLLVVVIGVARS